MANFTVNLNIELPLNSSYPGTWDQPVNSDFSIVDAAFGGLASQALVAANVVLSVAQAQNAFITLTGALSANVQVFIPFVTGTSTMGGRYYTVQNLTTNTSAFQVRFGSAVPFSEAIGLPWGEAVDVMIEPTTGRARFRNLGRVGTLWDYIGSSVPAWVSACDIPPYLACDGTTFSSATYPTLATILNGTTLPDSRGRARFTLNAGTSRITSSVGFGIDGETNLAAGGSQTISSANLPNLTLQTSITDPGHVHNNTGLSRPGAGIGGNPSPPGNDTGAGGTAFTLTNVSATTGITAQTFLDGSARNFLPPGYVGGITMIRAG